MPITLQAEIRDNTQSDLDRGDNSNIGLECTPEACLSLPEAQPYIRSDNLGRSLFWNTVHTTLQFILFQLEYTEDSKYMKWQKNFQYTNFKLEDDDTLLKVMLPITKTFGVLNAVVPFVAKFMAYSNLEGVFPCTLSKGSKYRYITCDETIKRKKYILN